MSAHRLLKELDSRGVKMEARQGQLLIDSPKGVITDDLRRELIASKAEILVLLSANPLPVICPQCGGTNRRGEQPNYYEAECASDPLHYSEVKKKAGCDRLWSDVLLPEEMTEQKTLHRALEGKDILSLSKAGLCEVGCGNWIQFYFIDGVGYGYCVKCRIDQLIGGRSE